MATDVTVRQVNGTSANIDTLLAADLSTASVDKADIITLTEVEMSSNSIVIVYTY